jgi:hypothetical protein
MQALAATSPVSASLVGLVRGAAWPQPSRALRTLERSTADFWTKATNRESAAASGDRFDLEAPTP